MRRSQRRNSCVVALVVMLAAIAPPASALVIPGVGNAPMNILAIWGDDIGWFNLSIHNFGIMGYQTPNLDKLGGKLDKDVTGAAITGTWGGMFTDAYAEQSCTAGRAAFITGQHGLRTGMIKVGLPGVDFGLHEDDPTLPQLLKLARYGGYATGQFGKNHLGDLNKYLPTNRGFDEFFGNLYHLNAQEEPEHEDWPDDVSTGDEDAAPFGTQFGPRGVIFSYSSANSPFQNLTGKGPEENIPYEDADYGDDVDGQTVVDTGPLTRHRMKTIDGAFARETMRFMAQARNARKPFFAWYAASRMHVWTHLKEAVAEYEEDTAHTEVPAFDSQCYTTTELLTQNDVCNLSLKDPDTTGYFAEGVTGYGTHPDGMVEHDMYVGQLLAFLQNEPADPLLADAPYASDDGSNLKGKTIVMYTSDNGPESFSWPDGGTTPFRSEKATNWEGAFRVPLLVYWPGKFTGGKISNEIIALQDWFPTLVNYAENTVADTTNADVHGDLAQTANLTPPSAPVNNPHTNVDYKAYLDGYDFGDYLTCVAGQSDTYAAACKGTGPRTEFIYANDDGVIVGIRYNDWKIVFHEQREESFAVWQEPFTALRFPKLMNLRSDPFEKADHDASYYDDYRADRMFALAPAQVAVYKFLQTFRDFPPRQAPPSFTVDVDVDDIIDKCGTAGDVAPHPECFPDPPDPSEDALIRSRFSFPNWGLGS